VTGYLLDKVTPQYIFNEMQAARIEYLRLTAVWEGKLQAAYTATQRSAAFVQGIKAANTIADEVSAALQGITLRSPKWPLSTIPTGTAEASGVDRMFK
jgi:hypothetical protein